MLQLMVLKNSTSCAVYGPAALPRSSTVIMFKRLETEQQQAMLQARGAGAACFLSAAGVRIMLRPHFPSS